MPYIRKGKTIYKKSGSRLISKGTSKTIQKAKDHLKVLQMIKNKKTLKKK